MKARLVKGETYEDIEIENFEVSYNKYEGIDLFVMLTPKDFIPEEELQTEAVDVNKPSSKGIGDDDEMFSSSIAVKDLFESDNKPSTLRLERQKHKINWCTDMELLVNFDKIEENRAIQSDTFRFIEANIIVFTETIKTAIKQLVEREKTFADDYFLYQIKEPYVIFGDKLEDNSREFHIYEEVTKIRQRKSVEDTEKDNKS